MSHPQGNPCARAAASRYRLLALGWLLVTGALAQQAAAPDSDPATIAARRFPQPVRVGALVNRAVLEPVESRRILGHVDEIVRLDGGKLAAIMTFGGFLGFGAHQIAVPLDAMVLLGNEMEVLDYTPEQLGAFPTYHGNGTALGTGEIIRVGLGHPPIERLVTTRTETSRMTMKLHPWPVRAMHWINAATMIIMILSGWGIYDDYVLIHGLHFSSTFRLGSWAAPSLLWHFAGCGCWR